MLEWVGGTEDGAEGDEVVNLVGVCTLARLVLDGDLIGGWRTGTAVTVTRVPVGDEDAEGRREAEDIFALGAPGRTRNVFAVGIGGIIRMP